MKQIIILVALALVAVLNTYTAVMAYRANRRLKARIDERMRKIR